MEKHPDIIAAIRYYTNKEAGRSIPTLLDTFRCPLSFEGKLFDCVIDLGKNGPLTPGEKATVPITFVRPDLIKARLKVGSRFTLWGLGTIGEGTVEQIL